MGKTIIISSHILSELQTLCNRVAIIERGRLIYTGPVQGATKQISETRIMWVKVPLEQHPRAIELLTALPDVRSVEDVQERLKVTLQNHETDPAILSATLVAAGVPLRGLREDEIGLEEVFMRVTKGETQ